MFQSILILLLVGCIFNWSVSRIHAFGNKISPKIEEDTITDLRLRKLSEKLLWVGPAMVFFCFLLALKLFYNNCIEQQVVLVRTFEDFGLKLDLISIPFLFIYDTLTGAMLFVVLSISFIVHVFSLQYMKEDPRLHVFMSYISLFTFFMVILVTSGSFYHMFFGWEGVGLCSYLLINFWYTRLQANKAAIKAMLVNRVGDLFLTLALVLIYKIFGSLNYGTVFALAPYLKDSLLTIGSWDLHAFTVITILLFLGAVGKSAQVGLHTWLPDAMEGPTPVSALIHAATMVTAGVFLLARCSPIVEYSGLGLVMITLFGAVTSFFAATTGLFQNDLKKVIAYSTCSQLGYMIFACGLSQYPLAIFHLANHAFFKALLFLSAGSVIHGLADEQDMRRMGGLAKLLPFSYSMILIGSLALMGLPFLTGFYSKDVIIEISYLDCLVTIEGRFSAWLGTGAAFFTAFYSSRLLFLTFYGQTNVFKSKALIAHEGNSFMIYPLIILCLGSIFLGYFSREIFLGLGGEFWSNSIFILPENVKLIDSEMMPVHIKLIPFIFTLIGGGIGYAFTYIMRLVLDKYNYIFLNNYGVSAYTFF